MELIATKLAVRGFWLRSGHAEGADSAFEKGAGGQAQIFLPWPSFNDHLPLHGWPYSQRSAEAMRIASLHHPYWNELSSGAKLLHSRNSHQVLGPIIGQSPISEFVVCWTRDGAVSEATIRTGGTGGAIRLAIASNVPVFNLKWPATRSHVELWLEAL